MTKRTLFVLIFLIPLAVFGQTSTFIPWGGVNQQTATYTAQTTDIGKLIQMNCSGCSLNLPAAAPYNKWTINVQNINAATITISPNGLLLDGSGASVSLPQNQGMLITSDGTNYYSMRGIGGSGGGTGNVNTNPLVTQDIVQPLNTRFSANNLAGIRYVVSSYNWQQSPSADLSIPGAGKTITLTPCPLGVTTAASANNPYYVYISTVGTPEATLVTGGTCTTGAASGTIVVTTVNAHAAGYTVGSASSGIKEASEEAKIIPTNPTGTSQSGEVIVPPGYEAHIYAPLYIAASQQVLDFSGSIVECNTVYPLPCIKLGADASTNTFTAIKVRNLRMRAMVPGSGGLEMNANGSSVDGLTLRNSATSAYFTHVVQIDNDQAASISHFDPSTGTGWGSCTTTAVCSDAIYGPGPFATNAGILYLSNSNLTINCNGNGINWNNGNTLSIKDTVIQGSRMYAVKTGTQSGGFGPTIADNVYVEVGSGCSGGNPFYGQTASAGYIVLGQNLTIRGGELAISSLPTFTNNASGATEYDYYIVMHNTALSAKTTPLFIGKSSVNSGTVTSISLKWPGTSFYTNVDTFDILRLSNAQTNKNVSVPYGTGNYAVATGVTTGAACTADICTFTDTNAALSSYTAVVPGATGWYAPKVSFWPGVIFLGSSADTTNAQSGPADLVIDTLPSQVTNVQGSTVQNIIVQGVTSGSGSMDTGSLTFSNAGGLFATVFNQITPTGNLNSGGPYKGRLNLWGATRNGGVAANNDIVTWVDSDPLKTWATNGHRPTADTADVAMGIDSYSAITNAGFYLRSPLQVSTYINSFGDNTNWKERIDTTNKTLKVNLLFSADNTFDIGAAGATRPRRLYAGTDFVGPIGQTTPALGTFTTAKAALYQTTTNCAASGTAANPSVVSCGAAPAGAVYCDVAASAGTCTVNTTAITATSRVFIELNSADGTELSKTCNAAPSVVPSMYYASKVNNTSFTINMPTGVTNGFCFDFWVVN